MSVFDPAVYSEVWCDASDFAVGAVLIQQSTPGSPRQPIEYLSKYLNSAEYNYSAIEREFIGLIQALHMWHYYVLDRPIIIRTDHASLQWSTFWPYSSRRQVHWFEFVCEFDLTITHVPGKANIIADALLYCADLDPARVAVVLVSVESDLLSGFCFSQEWDPSDTFCDLKYRALAGDRGMYKHDRLICHASGSVGQIIVILNDKALK